jgi:hypothetical protein
MSCRCRFDKEVAAVVVDEVSPFPGDQADWPQVLRHCGRSDHIT